MTACVIGITSPLGSYELVMGLDWLIMWIFVGKITLHFQVVCKLYIRTGGDIVVCKLYIRTGVNWSCVNWFCQLCMPSNQKRWSLYPCTLHSYIHRIRILTSVSLIFITLYKCPPATLAPPRVCIKQCFHTVWNHDVKGQSSLMDFISVSSRIGIHFATGIGSH